MKRDSNTTHSSSEWTEIATSLAITGIDRETSVIGQALGLTPLAEAQKGTSIHFGPGWWAYTLDERFSRDLGEQISALVSQVEPRREQLKALTEAGCSVQVAISGTVEGGASLTVSTESANQLADLGFPVTLTTLMEGNVATEDPMSWLD